jgi:sodium-independent sulfate anion transporter 11
MKMSLILIYYFNFDAFLGKIESGLPSFSLPTFSIQENNSTVTFLDMCSELGLGFVVIPMVAILANVAIAKAFGKYWYIDAGLYVTLYWSRVKFPS